jgi:tetratricopeptide (TPR) repeat protein
MDLRDIIEGLYEKQSRMLGDPRTTPEQWSALELKWDRLHNEWPEHPDIAGAYGITLIHLGKSALGAAMMERARTLGVPGPGTWINQALAYKKEHHDELAAKCYKKALEMADANPKLDERGINYDKAHALHGLAGLYVNAGQPHKCVYWAEKALKVDPDDRFARWNKALAHLELGEWEEGFRLYDEAGFIATPLKPMERKLKTYGGLPKWDGTPGQTVICYGEQGVGDEIMFASVLPDLMKDCRVIVDCDKRIDGFIKRSFPGLEAVYNTSDIDATFDWIKNHKPDAFLPMGNLGKHYRKKDADFPKVPYFKADSEKVEKWRDLLSGYKGLRVGISWAGGLKTTRFDKRTVPLSDWGDILQIPGVDFFSLQYRNVYASKPADEAATVGNKFGVAIHHWEDVIRDYEETAGLLANLDLVITVNTSLHHLCGALGIQQWCLTPRYVAWRYGTKGPSPWYGNCTMLRQREDGGWSNVMAQAKSMLVSRATQKVAA